ncbi:Serine carboxypeptidase-like 20 [Stylosanthes scabra]|uniref:Carboxypeptidase n=1 Tax=Stylosanthes scabra TaxID=79078 RepID=A0ABU6UCJ6_9FABA|nr:Serine carboxypeptidase-like 20 [Stylosanthes scabra]
MGGANRMFSLVLFHVFLQINVLTQSAPTESLVNQVPGFDGKLPSKHYAGYVTVDEDHGRNLYYYFVESESEPNKDPVVLWLNGGPGCSSLDGFVYEHGPFNFEKPTSKGALAKLTLNHYSWSKVSNIIYLDSPAGVGFSYSKNESDYITGDLRTANDAHAFLLKWFELYPEFQRNPLFLAGESYAGIYIPTLAQAIVRGIDACVKPILNFKGYLIGNGVTDKKFDGNALIPFTHRMGLISDEIFQESKKVCQGNYYDPQTKDCNAQVTKVNKIIAALNIYDILEPCYHSNGTSSSSSSNSRLPQSFKELGVTDRPLPVRKRMFGRAWPYRAIVNDGIVPTWPQLNELIKNDSDIAVDVPCTDDEVATEWLNNDEVRKAIHTVKKSVISEWFLCTAQLTYSFNAGSMIKYHKELTSRGYRALIYSGDHDMCVPYTGSQAWTSSLGYKIVDEWRPWFSDGQVAGFTQGYEKNHTFLTIKGAGHTVPEYKPKESLYFYKRFLYGKPI